ncbi:MAG: 30S ribosomal protein S20 [Chthonomonas sp.]|nr:30S ribosomal protein S20 [Chthonomonas sp.]
MANIKSMKKDLRRNAKRRAVNLGVKSGLKTRIKKVRTLAAKGTAADVAKALTEAQSALGKALQRGIIHKNQAARRTSRAAKAANKAAAK